MLYACDEKWWQHPGKAPEDHEFAGLRVVGKGEHPGCVPAHVKVAPMMIFEGKHIGGGGNSGFQAMNLAVKQGATRLLLLGFDFRGAHWFGQHPVGLKNPSDATMQRWVACMETAAKQLRDRGVEVVNCSRDSALTCFPRRNIRACL